MMETEKRLIRADETVDAFTKWLTSTYDGRMPVDIVNEIPTVDAVEVVHGEWTIIEDDYCGLIGLECSHCEKTWWFDEESPIREYHYCPGCGADMRERKDNE